MGSAGRSVHTGSLAGGALKDAESLQVGAGEPKGTSWQKTNTENIVCHLHMARTVDVLCSHFSPLIFKMCVESPAAPCYLVNIQKFVFIY